MRLSVQQHTSPREDFQDIEYDNAYPLDRLEIGESHKLVVIHLKFPQFGRRSSEECADGGKEREIAHDWGEGKWSW